MNLGTRRLLQLVLLAQGAAVLAIAGWAWSAGAPAWLAAAAGVGAVLLARLLINLNNFRMAARAAGAEAAAAHWQRLDARAALRLFAGEFKASMLVAHWHMPRARAAMRIHPGSVHPPVLLVHGYGCNSGYWAHLLPLLDAAGISHAGIDLEPVGGDIDGYVPLVQRRVQELLAASGAQRVAIVGHSMGGLVARAWLRAHGSAQVARIVTLGTPHHGTALANLGPGMNARQMRRGDADGSTADGGAGQGSAWLRALAATETPAMRALVTSIYTQHDNIVSPRASSVLPGARNIAFGGVGHVALGSDPRVLAEVMRELAALREPARSVE
jgi:triacylglycerol esterase/lipase EstA (alpha/beta hydrolase family)